MACSVSATGSVMPWASGYHRLIETQDQADCGEAAIKRSVPRRGRLAWTGYSPAKEPLSAVYSLLSTFLLHCGSSTRPSTARHALGCRGFGFFFVRIVVHSTVLKDEAGDGGDGDDQRQEQLVCGEARLHRIAPSWNVQQ